MASFSRGFLEFRFQYRHDPHWATLSISSRTFHGLSLERRESRNSGARGFLSNTVSPDFVTEHGQPFTNGECSPLSYIGEIEGIESHVTDRRKKSSGQSEFYRNGGKYRWTEQKRLWDN